MGTLASGNYTFIFVVGDLDVTKATLTVAADNQSRIYGDANPSSRPATRVSRTARHSGPVTSRCADALHAGDADERGRGGPYVITSAMGTLAAGNYAFTFVAGNLDVTKATLVVTADDQSRNYGDGNPGLTSFSGFKNGETRHQWRNGATLSTSVTPTSSVSGSPYVITSAIGTLASGNYTFSFVVGDLNVTKATLTVTADDQSRFYGDANPSSRPGSPDSRTARPRQ